MADSLPSARQMRKVLRSLKTPNEIATERIIKTIGKAISASASRGESQLVYLFPHQIAELPMFNRATVFANVAKMLDDQGYSFEIEDDNEKLIIDWSTEEEGEDEGFVGQIEEVEQPDAADEEERARMEIEQKRKAAAELEAIRRRFTKGGKKKNN